MKEKVQTIQGEDYVSPRVECIEVVVEAGFQASLGGTGNEDYTIEEGDWDEI